jgi:hypothetical protein
LAEKYKKPIKDIIAAIGKNCELKVEVKGIMKTIVSFFSSMKVQGFSRGFSQNEDKIQESLKQINKRSSFKLSVSKVLYESCIIKNCNNTDIEVHHIRGLVRRYKGGLSNIQKREKTRDLKSDVKEFIFRKKQIPLCKKHHIA